MINNMIYNCKQMPNQTRINSIIESKSDKSYIFIFCLLVESNCIV